MEDHRAHERITSLEVTMAGHIAEHATLLQSIVENTAMTRTISENTSELVTLIKGVKGLRSFLLWLAPLIAAIGTLWAAITYWRTLS